MGERLVKRLGCQGTSRRFPSNYAYFDMLTPDFGLLAPYDVIYLCAAHNGSKSCEGNQDSWRVNVDSPIDIALNCKSSFIVWFSSLSIEWLDGAYQRQKRQTEAVLRLMPNVSIIRPGRILNSNVEELVDLVLLVSRSKTKGVTRWGTDGIPHQK